MTRDMPLLDLLDLTRPLPPFSALVVKVAVALVTWETRARTRKQLAALDDHLLKDIGLARRDATREANRRFYQR
ncbi:DUF1127 domain-containing protein [Nereida sp. MMG025]|uniref:DUF1127 domain-containing protein n=1 Tax=Nereida sp. MMG025 TaxID=2909981 RepID=UPI001F1E459C|nr:DUF1127 domain-containing protein [Nereida sp. MMG025]MCF6443240.1 DUF1127 domain-containing protein [Nereida sp. MMG025]